jgi:hypothetical protein
LTYETCIPPHRGAGQAYRRPESPDKDDVSPKRPGSYH